MIWVFQWETVGDYHGCPHLFFGYVHRSCVEQRCRNVLQHGSSQFQYVVVANTGEFAGSSTHAPLKDVHKRTMFHSHGNEQVSIGFFDIVINQYHRNRKKLKPPSELKEVVGFA